MAEDKPREPEKLNVDVSSPSRDFLDSRRPAQAGVKDSYPSKKWLFYSNYFVQRENGGK